MAAAHAQSTGVAGGTLSWTSTESGGTCGEYHTSYTEWSFSSFKFVYGGTTYPLSGGAVFFQDQNPNGCPPPGAEPAVLPMTLPSSFGTNCIIDFSAESGGQGSATFSGCSVPGYINPKYQVIGVTYVPPGSQSYVQYCDNTTVSETDSITNTFLSSYQASVKVSVSVGLFGWVGGTTTGSSSSTYSQTSKNTKSDTVSQTTSLCTKTPGAQNSFQPTNHDYDVVWLWLNPVVLITYQENANGAVTGITWNGYGFSTLDQPAMDVFPVYVGCLNGDLTAANGCELGPLARTWAAGEIWPSGQGPGLTSSDYTTILQADPYSECTPHPTQCPTTPNPERFTITDNEDIPYVQPPIGGQPVTETFMEGYTQSDMQSQDYTQSGSVSFGLETVFKGTIFSTGVTTTFSNTNTFTWTNEVNSSLTNTDGNTATASVTGPTCTVSGSSCNPVYTGPTEFDVYEDTFYGTFFFNPAN
jgi:hypothetical protein